MPREPKHAGDANPAEDEDDKLQLVTPVVRALRLLKFIAEGGSTANLSEVGS